MLAIITLIGAICLFFYAMQLISESLQKIAGDHLRHAQSSMTGNAFKGMLAGLGVSAFVQSSLITTMMAVSFVNTGLITLAQSMAVIMGANIGTTVTSWIIATLGFRLDITLWAFPIIALALPLFNSRKSTANSWGEMLLGTGLFLISLETMEQVFGHGNLISYDCWLAENGINPYLGYGISLLSGIVVTALVRSSNATFALTLLACTSGAIGFETACAIIIGANIGTCLPPIIASRKGNAMARRAALGHLLFNVIGMIWAVSLLPWCCRGLIIAFEAAGLSAADTAGFAPIGLALFHTLFNVITTLLLLPLTNWLVAVVSRVIPQAASQGKESFQLQYINSELLPTSGEMALVQVQKEVSRYAADTYQMFSLVRQMVQEPMGSERQLALMKETRQMEDDSDKIELQIAQFLNQIAPQTLSMSGEQLCRSMYKVVDELESIADSTFHCSTILFQKSEQRVRFTPQMNESLKHMLDLTDAAMQHMRRMLELNEVPAYALDRAYNFEDEINNLRNQLRNQMLDAMERREVEFQQQTYFMFIINECEKIGDYIINVIAAASL